MTVTTPSEIRFQSGRHELYGKLWAVGPDRPTLLLLHGLGFHTFEYDTLAPLLVSAGFGCFAFDFRGHGRSQGPRGRWCLAELVEDARSALTVAGTPVGVFGNSLGAIVGVYLAASDRRVASLAASGCPTRVADFGVTPLRLLLLRLLQVVDRLVHVRVSLNLFEPYPVILSDPDVIRRVSADVLITDARRLSPSTYADIFEWNALPVAPQITVPLLVLAAMHDRLQPVAQSRLLFEAATAPKRFELLDTSHVPNLENPDLLAPILQDWFRRTLARR